MKILVLLVYCCISFSVTLSNRLYPGIDPIHYSIKIRPHLDHDTFDGEVRIYFRAENEVPVLTLHTLDLKILQSSIDGVPVICHPMPDQEVDCSDYQIGPGEHILDIKYRGRIWEKGTGLLKVLSDEKHNGYLLLTDFYPAGARRVFPCFDEPAFKSKFNIRLIVPDDMVALSVMPEINVFNTSNLVVFDFATTFPMSTFMLSFAVTNYSNYEDTAEDNGKIITTRIYSQDENEGRNEYIMDCVRSAIKFNSQFTDIEYPFSKLDIIDYNTSYAEDSLKYGFKDEHFQEKSEMQREYIKYEKAHFSRSSNRGSSDTKKEFEPYNRVYEEDWHIEISIRRGVFGENLSGKKKSEIKEIIYHQIAHSWLGNLVTHEWWNDLWLLESFTIYLTYKKYEKERGRRKQDYRFYYFNPLYEIYRDVPSRPLVDFSVTNHEVDELRDDFVNEKGAALLLMIEDIISEQEFRYAMQTFLKNHEHESVTTNDFISILEKAMPYIKLRDFMESYLYQDRLPMIRVKGSNGKFVIRQEVCRTRANFSTNGSKWTIPIKYVTNIDSSESIIWFDRDEDEVIIESPGAKWILLNTEGVGIYKVVFEEDAWNALIAHLGELNLGEMHSLVHEVMYAFKFELVSCSAPIQLMQKNKLEKAWVFFNEFHDIIHDSLKCNGYRDELDIYMKFLNEKIEETKYTNKWFLKKGPEDCSKTEEWDIDWQKCARWIRYNLSENKRRK